MKILFIYPNKEMVPRAPLGFGYLSAHLKKEGHSVELFDTTFMKCGESSGGDDNLRANSLQVVNPDLAKYGIIEANVNVFEELNKKIKEFKPDIIGANFADPNYEFGIELFNYIKEKYDIKTIAGGCVPAFCPEGVISNNCVDMICIGEGEEAFVELVDALENHKDYTKIKNIWIKENGQIYKNPLRPLQNINEILSPDLSIYDQRHFIRPLGGNMFKMSTPIWTRGCLFNCKYCGSPAFKRIYENLGKFYRIKDTKLMIKQLLDEKEKYNFEFFFFHDDIFPLHIPEIIDEFCKLYKEQIKLPFSINLQPSLVTEEALAKVIDAGCVNVCIGLESGNPEIRKNVLGRHYDNEQVIKVFNIAHKYKIRCSSFNMIGLPNETREDIFKTIELNRQANPTSATLTFFHPYRGCELREICIKEKYFDPTKDNKDKKEGGVYRSNSNLNLPQISNKELQTLFQNFQLYFKLPKEFWPLIELSEKDDEFSEYIREDILKPAFKYITKNEAVWDFSKIIQRLKSS